MTQCSWRVSRTARSRRKRLVLDPCCQRTATAVVVARRRPFLPLGEGPRWFAVHEPMCAVHAAKERGYGNRVEAL